MPLDTPEGLRALRHAFYIEELLSPLRHDLRNRLAALRNAAFYLRRRVGQRAPALLADDPRVTQMFDLFDSELGAADALVGSRLAPVTADAAADAAAIGAAVASAIGAPATVHLAGPGSGPAPARIDPLELELALWCLVENAVDAVEARGGTIAIRCASDGSRTRVEVTDDGPGLAPNTEARVFEPFYSTRPGRLGLGLNTARRIAARAGGTLELSGGPGLRACLVLPS